MPVYLFTFHAHGSWLPDHKKGYTRRKQGVLPTDPHMAGHYRDNMSTAPVHFIAKAQQTILAAMHEKAAVKGWTLHALATDPTHVHILLSWSTATPWLDVRRGLKASITRQLNTHLRHQTWLAAGGSRKRVTDRAHFNHLITTYLPNHRGITWVAPPTQKTQMTNDK